MCSQAMANARQTPILASPSANIAGSQTNRFITASYVPLGASAQEAAPSGNGGPAPRRKHQPAQPAGRRWLATAAAVNGSVSFPLCFDEAS